MMPTLVPAAPAVDSPSATEVHRPDKLRRMARIQRSWIVNANLLDPLGFTNYSDDCYRGNGGARGHMTWLFWTRSIDKARSPSTLRSIP